MALDPGQVARAGERATAQQHVAAAPTRAGGQARASHGEPVCGENVGGETVGGETAVLTATAPPTTTPGDATIAFEDVHFGYDEDADVIDGISFHLSPGDRVALVGESGGGKTTIVNLLLGLYRMRSGRIEVAGVDVGAGNLAELRGRSEEHTSELQSRFDLVCRPLLEKKDVKY